MRKNSTDHPSLFNRNFGLVCVAGFLLYVTAYAVLLPLMRSGLASDLCFPFLIGMQLGGLFSAWLADKFRRKHVLGYPFVGMLLVSIGYAYASTASQYAALALLHGVCFGLASSAAVTLSIDVVHSGLRTQANTTYAFVSRLGMVVGGVAAWWLMPLNTYQWLMPVLFGGVGVLAAALMYVPFRAPIGLPVVSTDRYVLPRAVLPGLNVAVLAVALVGADVRQALPPLPAGHGQRDLSILYGCRFAHWRGLCAGLCGVSPLGAPRMAGVRPRDVPLCHPYLL